MANRHADATAGGKKFDDVLRQLALRLSDMAVTQASREILPADSLTFLAVSS